jgi:hypothetical protein
MQWITRRQQLVNVDSERAWYIKAVQSMPQHMKIEATIIAGTSGTSTFTFFKSDSKSSESLLGE